MAIYSISCLERDNDRRRTDGSSRQRELWRGAHLDCMHLAGDCYPKGLPHFCPVFLLDRISRSLPADVQRLTWCPESTGCVCLPLESDSFFSIASAMATAMAATLSLVGSSASITLVISMAPFLPGNSRVSSMIATMRMNSAIITTVTPRTAISAGSASRSNILPTTPLIRR